MPSPTVKPRFRSPRLFKAILDDIGPVRCSALDPGGQERDQSIYYEGGNDFPVDILDGVEKEITVVISRAKTDDSTLHDWYVSRVPKGLSVQTLDPATRVVVSTDQFLEGHPKAYKQPTKFDAKGNEHLMEEVTATFLRKKVR